MSVKKWIQHISILVTGLFLLAGMNGYARLWAADSASSDTVTVTIEQAEKTEYQRDPDSGEEVIRFTGNVSLTVDNRGSHIGIQAETITFNRARATVFASGNVVFEQSGSGRNTETLTAGTLLFNTRTLEGVFDNGRVVQEHSGNINLPTGSVLVVFADSFGRENSGTVTFRNGVLTFCDAPEPHWRINASRIWLLPGNEFAIFSGLMYVGNFPVLYIPFFYYPKEEMIFNPSFGYDARKGYFTMTTTYVVGRKGLQDSASSGEDDGIFDFLKTTTLKEQVREGLFLHNLDADASMSENSLKILADVYTNLGYLAGVEGSFKPEKYVNSLDFGAYLGFSKTLFPVYSPFGAYTTFSPTNQQYYDTGWFLGASVPFRFGANLKASFYLKPVTLNLSLPLYSDPYFTSDFISGRKESMDWINFLMNNVASSGTSSSAVDTSILSSYTWSLSGSVSTPAFLSSLKPWIQEFSLSNFSSQVNFLTKANADFADETKENRLYDPNRNFYYPSMVQPLKANMRISGKLFSWGGLSPDSTTPEIPYLELPSDISRLASPSDSDNGTAENTDSSAGIALIAPPTLSFTRKPAAALQGFTWDVSYTVLPSLITEINYDAANFSRPSAIQWTDIKNRYLQLKCPVTIKSATTWRGGFIGLTSSLEFQPVYQEHTDFADSFYTADGDATEQLDKILESDYKARTLNLNDVNSLVFKPFQYVDSLSGSSVSWNMGVRLIRTEFTGTAEAPAWEYKMPRWDDASFSSHNVSGVLAMTQQNNRFSEKISLKVNLPPLNERYETSVTVSFPGCTGLSFATAWSKDSTGQWKEEPVSQSSSWSFFGGRLTASESYRYNREESHSESLTFSTAGFGASLSFSMLYTTPYHYVENTGWVAENDNKLFLPYSVNMRYNLPFNGWYYLQNRISLKPVLNATMALNLIRPTLSTFAITSGFTFKISEFLDLTVSAESQNKVMYRYIQQFVGSGVTIPGEENILVDLWNSFSLWDVKALRNSGFKLRNISIALDHNLHDWTLHSEFKVSPRLVTGNGASRYDYSPYFVLSVKWNPMSSLKTTIQDNYGEFILNPPEN